MRAESLSSIFGGQEVEKYRLRVTRFGDTGVGDGMKVFEDAFIMRSVVEIARDEYVYHRVFAVHLRVGLVNGVGVFVPAMLGAAGNARRPVGREDGQILAVKDDVAFQYAQLAAV